MKGEFEALLRPELFLEISGSGELQAKEVDRSAVLKCLHIKCVPKGSVAFELDHHPKGDLKKKLRNGFKQLSCLIHGEHEMANKSCDFVIISPNENSAKIILGDLKSRNVRRSSCAAQLRNSEIFLHFLLSLLLEYHGRKVVPNFRKVVFYVASPINSKAPTQQRHQLPTLKGDEDEVVYYPVTLRGRNNSHAIVVYPSFS